MRNLVWASTIKESIQFLKDLVNKMEYKNIKQINQSKDNMFVELVDGSSYKVISNSECCRGLRADRVYVSKKISNDIINKIIKPSLSYSKLPTEEQIVYFNTNVETIVENHELNIKIAKIIFYIQDLWTKGIISNNQFEKILKIYK
jgi:hypothetical protein